jgi:hypothetical protein
MPSTLKRRLLGAFGLAASASAEYPALSTPGLARMWFNQQLWLVMAGVLLQPESSFGEIKLQRAANAKAAPDGVEFFEKRIRPLFVDRCYECHSATSGRAEGGLRLDTRDGLLQGGVSGPAVVPSDPTRGALIKTLVNAGQQPATVTRHRLPIALINELATWVLLGAPDPRTTKPEIRNSKLETPLHWSFQPLLAPNVPSVHHLRWPNHDIDRFILARMEVAGLAPALAADKRTLIRRVTFDLTGLPPTPEEVDAFLRDRSAGAYEKLVERLLASPRYGERWGRHWLDVARYADSSGDNSDFPIPQARFYRDYVIDSFNHDKPYARFLREQMAGDLMPAENAAQSNELAIATGFIALSRRFGAGLKETEHLTIEDTLETMGRAVLGLSMSCARCHDHKYDPISMQDYYALYGIFASTRYPYPGSEPRTYQTNFVSLHPTPEIEESAGPLRRKLNTMDDELDRMDAQIKLLEKERLSTTDLNAAYDKLDQEADDLAMDLATLDTAYAVADDQPINARVQKRGESWNLGDEIPRGFLKVLGGQRLPADCQGSGRLELAEWLCDPANPLTARVMVNRIWQHHFGRGLVATPNDFGRRGQAPTHPELLDYLAARFIESGWSVKAMHRLILLSATYQQGSLGSLNALPEPVGNVQRSTFNVERSKLSVVGQVDGPDSRAALNLEASHKAARMDPDNTLLSHFPRQRLDAEEIRDALLFVSGDLDLTPVGPHPFPPAHTWKFSQHVQFNAVYETRHRSVYLMQQRIKKHPFLATFDGADANASTAERGVTTTPLQALFLMNDPFAYAQAESFARRLLREASDDPQRINRAHQLAFGRTARSEEVREGLAYLEAFRRKLLATKAVPENAVLPAWSSYARALLGSNEFMFVD